MPTPRFHSPSTALQFATNLHSSFSRRRIKFSGALTLSLVCALPQLSTAQEWKVSGELRARYEQLDGRFRPGRRGEDHILATMLNVKAERSGDGFGAVFEFLDARAFADQDDTALGTAIVNAAEPIQFALQHRAGDRLFRAGRLTIDMGSRRLVARNIFRNTTETFDGMEYRNRFGQQRVQAFAVLPIERLPGDPQGLQDNSFELDRSSTDRRFLGILWGHEGLAEGLDLELYALHLSDDRARAGTGQRYFTPGLRLRWSEGDLDFEFEGAVQTGRIDDGAGNSLDHRAGFFHAELGRLISPGNRIALELDWASGDSNPLDGRSERFDDLFSAVVGDMGPTGILGTLRRSNVRAASLRHEWRFSEGYYLRSALRRVYLDQPRDQWVGSGIADASGQSGRDLGWFFDTRLRISSFDGWRSDIGFNWIEKSDLASGLIAGSPQSRTDDHTGFVYVELSRFF